MFLHIDWLSKKQRSKAMCHNKQRIESLEERLIEIRKTINRSKEIEKSLEKESEIDYPKLEDMTEREVALYTALFRVSDKQARTSFLEITRKLNAQLENDQEILESMLMRLKGQE